jgi:hypothetical protein
LPGERKWRLKTHVHTFMTKVEDWLKTNVHTATNLMREGKQHYLAGLELAQTIRKYWKAMVEEVEGPPGPDSESTMPRLDEESGTFVLEQILRGYMKSRERTEVSCMDVGMQMFLSGQL